MCSSHYRNFPTFLVRAHSQCDTFKVMVLYDLKRIASMLKKFELEANVASSWPSNNLKYFFRNDKVCACMVKLLFKITLRTLLYEVIAGRFGQS